MDTIDHAIKSPLTVTAPGGKVYLFTVRPGETSATFQLMATAVADRVATRLTGGCKGMDKDDKSAMTDYFLAAYAGYRGLLFSGATRQLDADGRLDPMVTDMVVFIAQDPRNIGSVALGTVPQTDVPTLQHESQLVLDQYGTRPNPGMSGIMIVQSGTDDLMDWDGDLKPYFEMLDRLMKFGGFKATHLTAWNGGAITENEIMMGARRGWPVFLVQGSGRVADELASEIVGGNFGRFEKAGVHEKHFGNIHIVPKDDPSVLRGHLLRLGFIAPEAAA